MHKGRKTKKGKKMLNAKTAKPIVDCVQCLALKNILKLIFSEN